MVLCDTPESSILSTFGRNQIFGRHDADIEASGNSLYLNQPIFLILLLCLASATSRFSGTGEPDPDMLGLVCLNWGN